MWFANNRQRDLLPVRKGTGEQELNLIEQQASGWAMEAGFWGIEIDFDARLEPLVRAGALAIFGETDRAVARLRNDLSVAEGRLCEAAATICDYLQGARALDRGGLLSRIRKGIEVFLAYRRALSASRKLQPVVDRLQRDLSIATNTHGESVAWQHAALKALRETCRFQKMRAEIARGKENTHEQVRLVVRRAN